MVPNLLSVNDSVPRTQRPSTKEFLKEGRITLNEVIKVSYLLVRHELLDVSI